MKTVNIHEAKTTLSRLLESVEAGEEIIVARAGKPVARLIKYVEPPKKMPRVPGAWKGQVWMAPDFDACDAEIQRLFEGEDDESSQ